SAENVVTYSPPIRAASVMRRWRAFFSTMTSFRAHCGSSQGAPSARASRAKRSSTRAFPSRRRLSSVGASAGSTSVKKPNRPTFTPSTGTFAWAASWAARRSVPSPPTDRTRSSPSPKDPIGTFSSAPRSSPSSPRVEMPRSRSHRIRSSAASRAPERPACTTRPTLRRFARAAMAGGELLPFLDGPFQVGLDRSGARIRSGAPPGVQEELHVPRRAHQRRGHDTVDLEAQLLRGHSHGPQDTPPHLRVSYDPAPAIRLGAAGFELRLHEQHELRAGRRASHERRQNQSQGDEREVRGDQIW